jgi:hypothetical protein
MSQQNPCITVINKIVFEKNGQEGKTGPVWGRIRMGGRGA